MEQDFTDNEKALTGYIDSCDGSDLFKKTVVMLKNVEQLIYIYTLFIKLFQT
jgi:hypothetical protein